MIQERIESLLRSPFKLLVTDEGAGTLHGDPSARIHSPTTDRVIFVHLGKLSSEFNTIFSVEPEGTFIDIELLKKEVFVLSFLILWIIILINP